MACLLSALARIAPIVRTGMTDMTSEKLPCYPQAWTYSRPVIPVLIHRSPPVPPVFRAAFGVGAQRVQFGEIRLWPVDLEFEVARRLKPEDQSHHSSYLSRSGGEGQSSRNPSTNRLF